MRVVVIGATGNVGTSLLPLLSASREVTSVIAVARRPATLTLPKVEWVGADIRHGDLVPIVDGADVVVHLAWAIQPSHDERTMADVNIRGSRRLFDAVASTGVGSLVYASSVGAYAPGPRDRRIDEGWPTDGVRGSFYSRHKAAVERILDRFEDGSPHVRVVRMRPALTFKLGQGSEARRLFLGPLLPSSLVRHGALPFLPDVGGFRFQAVHTADVADAYLRAIVGTARGAFNVAAEPVLDMRLVAEVLGTRVVRVPTGLVRGAVAASWYAHLQPTPPGWLEMGLRLPFLSSERAHLELGWRPRRSAIEALRQLLQGIATGEGGPTARLEPGGAGTLRSRELATGIGSWDDARTTAPTPPPGPTGNIRP